MVGKSLLVDHARNSVLDQMLSDNYGDNVRILKGEQFNEIFIDRDPVIFGKLVKYLRTDMQIYPKFENSEE